jgi:hypothetical protein
MGRLRFSSDSGPSGCLVEEGPESKPCELWDQGSRPQGQQAPWGARRSRHAFTLCGSYSLASLVTGRRRRVGWLLIRLTLSVHTDSGFMTVRDGPYATTKAAIVTLMECLYGQLRDAQADIVTTLIFPGLTDTLGDPEATRQSIAFLRANGLPATFTEPQEVAANAIETIRSEGFWARPSMADKDHRETVEWESQIYRTRAEAIISRNSPDAYLWGPPSRLLGP